MQLPDELGNELVMRLLLIAGVIIVLLLLVRLVSRILGSTIQDPTKSYLATRAVRRGAAALGFVVCVVILSPDSSGLVTVLTVIGAGLAISLREALLSIAGWLRLVTMNDYRIGERIEIGGVHGDVIDIRLLRTTVMETRAWVEADQSSGRIAHIPNAWVWLHTIHNYNRGFNFIWNELSFTVTFQSDWKAAQAILLDLADESAAIVEKQAAAEIQQMSREFLIHYGILTPFVYVGVKPDGVKLTLRYLCEVRKRRGTEHALTISVLDAFEKQGDIQFAHPSIDIRRTDPDGR